MMPNLSHKLKYIFNITITVMLFSLVGLLEISIESCRNWFSIYFVL